MEDVGGPLGAGAVLDDEGHIGLDGSWEWEWRAGVSWERIAVSEWK